jgi:quercetin dioxygenase-like cupin family protein
MGDAARGNDEVAGFVEWRPGVVTRMHAAHSTGARSLCVFEQLCEPGTGAPWHWHEGVEEVIVVVEGRGRFSIGSDEKEVEAGGAFRFAAGCRHAFVNVGDGILRLIATFASATPPVEYEDQPGVLEIGRRSDRHRMPVETGHQ